MMEKIRPLADRVLVKRLSVEDNHDSLIVIPDVAKEKPLTAKVIAVGAGRTTLEGKVIPMQVKAGDLILFGKYAGTETSNDYLIVREDEILGVIEK